MINLGGEHILPELSELLEKYEEQVKNSQPKLTYLSLDTTGACDLRCSMCYYNESINLTNNFVPLPLLKEKIKEAHDKLGLKSLVFSGKEPLLNFNRFEELAFWARKSLKSDIEIGLITNGVYLNKKFDFILESGVLHDMDFIDISIDSDNSAKHDEIRGKVGGFDHSVQALKKLNLKLPSLRIGASSVLFASNANELKKFIIEKSNFNKVFFVTPVQPPPYTSIVAPDTLYISSFIKQIKETLRLEIPKKNVEVMISVLGIHVYDLIKLGAFEPMEVKIDEHNQIYVEFPIYENTLILHLQIVPETASNIAKITYDGHYLTNTHFLQVEDPKKFSVGNIQDSSMEDLYYKSMDGNSIFNRIFESRKNHQCKERECWNTCFGGFVGTEHNIVRKENLTQRPFLCTR